MAGRNLILYTVSLLGLAQLAACAPPQQLGLLNSVAELQPAQTPAPLAAGGLVGSTPAVLNAELGQPVLRRLDGTSQVWLYHSSVCGLNLILFPDNAGVPRVAAAVPDGDDPVSCMASLQRGQPAQTAALEHAGSS